MMKRRGEILEPAQGGVIRGKVYRVDFDASSLQSPKWHFLSQPGHGFQDDSGRVGKANDRVFSRHPSVYPTRALVTTPLGAGSGWIRIP